MTTPVVVANIEGASLTADDRSLLKHPALAGLILFARNYENKIQIKALIDEIRSIHKELIIMIDQEGGRVQRFRDGFTTLPSMRSWSEKYDASAFRQTIKTMVNELQELGVDVTLAPVLDLDLKLNEVIGERSFGADPENVARLAREFIEVMHENKMPACGKHYPGHGGTEVDSHLALPIDRRDWTTIESNDLKPFVALLDVLPAIMTAHILFPAIDPLPVTFSSYWLQRVLREQLKFAGVIISDDLSMNAAATQGNYAQRAKKALEAGCDLLLLCNNREGAWEALHALEDYESIATNERLNHYRKLSKHHQ